MPIEILPYSSPEPKRPNAATPAIAWISVIFGTLATACVPVLMGGRDSMAGFFFAPLAWLLAVLSTVFAVIALALRRRGAVVGIGLFLGVFVLLLSTIYMLIPVTRHEF